MATTKADDSQVYQLKIGLRGSQPPIWRRVQVRGSTTLARLHRILQIVMGWEDYHLHQFIELASGDSPFRRGRVSDCTMQAAVR